MPTLDLATFSFHDWDGFTLDQWDPLTLDPTGGGLVFYAEAVELFQPGAVTATVFLPGIEQGEIIQ